MIILWATSWYLEKVYTTANAKDDFSYPGKKKKKTKMRKSIGKAIERNSSSSTSLSPSNHPLVPGIP
jgi:hypothetical protein